MHLNIEVTVARSCVTFKRRSHRVSRAVQEFTERVDVGSSRLAILLSFH